MKEEILVVADGVGEARGGGWVECHVIGVCIEQRHSAVSGDPIEFLEPDGGGGFAEQEEQGGILGERIREFNVAAGGGGRRWEMGDGRWGRFPICHVRTSISFCGRCPNSHLPSPISARGLDPKWEYGTDSVGLGFEGVGVEGGTVVLDVEVVEPIELTEHEPGAEPDDVPVVEVTVDVLGVITEGIAGSEQFAVVMEVMDADFEPVVGEPGAKVGGHGVAAFRNEIEGGSEPE
jgi:hypothetical protein